LPSRSFGVARRSSPTPYSDASTDGAASGEVAKSAGKVQYSSGTNARISSSRSTIRRSATDCTRPAEMPEATVRHSTGESR
jgi:hypothetical protein